MKSYKFFFSETAWLSALIIGMWYHLKVLYKVCYYFAPRVKIDLILIDLVKVFVLTIPIPELGHKVGQQETLEKPCEGQVFPLIQWPQVSDLGPSGPSCFKYYQRYPLETQHTYSPSQGECKATRVITKQPVFVALLYPLKQSLKGAI